MVKKPSVEEAYARLNTLHRCWDDDVMLDGRLEEDALLLYDFCVADDVARELMAGSEFSQRVRDHEGTPPAVRVGLAQRSVLERMELVSRAHRKGMHSHNLDRKVIGYAVACLRSYHAFAFSNGRFSL